MKFIFGLIFDQGIGWKAAWKGPTELEGRLGKLDVGAISRMSLDDLEKVMRTPKSLHRFPRKVARWLILASRHIEEGYGGDPAAVWSDKPVARDLQNRFDDFPGIDQKKASMAVNILVRDYGVLGNDALKHLDVSFDIHVRRVFLRTGLVDRDREEDVVKAARELNPAYPGALDLPAWKVGHNWCHYTHPDCANCPLDAVCPKLTSRAVPRGQ